jgi:chloramphenicol O-acetyltransferase type A
MKEIDLATWDRKEHFNFFSSPDIPFYNTNFNLDISGVKEYAKEKNVSLNNTLIYLTVSAMSSVRNFLYRIENDKVVEYDGIDPSFACLKDNEELFRLITLKYTPDLLQFDRDVKDAIEKSSAYFDLHMLKGRSNFVFISSLPWVPFTGLDHTISLNKNDSIPRVSWGKYYENNGRILLPYNIRVNHRLVDGIHIGRFYDKLNELMDAIRNNF